MWQKSPDRAGYYFTFHRGEVIVARYTPVAADNTVDPYPVEIVSDDRIYDVGHFEGPWWYIPAPGERVTSPGGWWLPGGGGHVPVPPPGEPYAGPSS